MKPLLVFVLFLFFSVAEARRPVSNAVETEFLSLVDAAKLGNTDRIANYLESHQKGKRRLDRNQLGELLHQAVRFGRTDTALFLVEKGASSFDRRKKEVRKKLLVPSSKPKSDYRGSYSQSELDDMLSLAQQERTGESVTVRRLERMGATAAGSKPLLGTRVVDSLREFEDKRYPIPEAKTVRIWVKGEDALQLAILYRQDETLFALLERLERPDRGHLLGYAVSCRRLNLAEGLLEQGYTYKPVRIGEKVSKNRIRLKNLALSLMDGRLSLAQAIDSEREVAPQALLEEQPMIVHWRAMEGSSRELRALLERGFPMDATDSSGRTPLMCALEAGNEDNVQWLRERGYQ